ncbi:hypothetical protein RJ55_02740 [Drechmeria coniospora]|nr:hypothetical protein RJ55_02740 [Drechmeria coniospora]
MPSNAIQVEAIRTPCHSSWCQQPGLALRLGNLESVTTNRRQPLHAAAPMGGGGILDDQQCSNGTADNSYCTCYDSYFR